MSMGLGVTVIELRRARFRQRDGERNGKAGWLRVISVEGGLLGCYLSGANGRRIRGLSTACGILRFPRARFSPIVGHL